jgi:hypothetical protein
MTTIDCQTCPVRGRMCGDCFVPVVARQWLSDPVPVHYGRGDPSPTPAGDPGVETGLELDDAEWEAVDVFVRAGLVNALDAAGLSATRARRVWSDVG